MTNDEMKDLAARIARDVFTAGDGNDTRADKVKLCAGDRYLGGWSECALAGRIYKHLTGELKKGRK